MSNSDIDHSLDREIFAKFLSNSCPVGCMRKSGHTGFHTTSPEIAKKADEEPDVDYRSGELH